MFAKLIADSLAVWTTDYKIDGFRFDLMGYHPKAQILSARERIKALNPDIYFFGEGWDSNQSDRFEIASQINLKGTGIGTFSDRLRDAVRGGGPFDSGDALRQNQGVGSGAGVLPNELTTLSDDQARHLADLTRLGMAGNLADFVLIDKDGAVKRGSEIDYNGAPGGYAADPTEVVNYVSKHDNQTLWDMISYKAAQEADLDTRVRMQAVSLATVMLGGGSPLTSRARSCCALNPLPAIRMIPATGLTAWTTPCRTTTTTSVCRAAAMMAATMTLSPG